MNSMQLIKLVELLMRDKGCTLVAPAPPTQTLPTLKDKIRISKRGHAISCICI